MPTSPREMMNSMLTNLEEKSGNTLSHWITIVENSGEEKHMAIIKHLKTNHGLTHGYANLIAFKFRERFESPKSGNEMVDDLFSGAKANLKPIYDKLGYIGSIIRKRCRNITKKNVCHYSKVITVFYFQTIHRRQVRCRFGFERC